MPAKVLGSAVIPISMGLDKLDAQLADARAKVSGGMDRIASGAKAALGAAGVAAGGALSYGIVRTLDIEAGTDKMAASLGLTAEQSAQYGATAGRLYADAYGGSLGEVNGAIAAVATSLKGAMGEGDAALEATTAKALDLATAFEIDLAKAVNSAGILISSGLAADADEAMDLLVASLQKVPVHLREDLLDASDEYGAFFADLGFSGEAAMSVLVKATEDGMYGIDKTGDALKELTIRATDMSKTSTNAYKAAGLDAEDMAAKILAGGSDAKGAFGDIVTGLLAIKDPTERANAAIGLFGTPLEDLAVTDIPKFLAGLLLTGESLGTVAGAADEMGATLNDNAATNLESFRRTMDAKLVGFIGGKVLPSLTSLPGPMSDVALGIFGMGGSAIGALAPIGQMTGGFRGMGGALGKVPEKIGSLVKGVGSMVASVGRGTAALVRNTAAAGANAAKMAASAAVHVAKWAWMGVQALASAAKVALAWLISMGPIILVAAAVAGLVALIVIHWDTIKRVTAALWEGIKTKVGAVWGWIKDKVSTALGFLTNLFLNFTGPGLLIKHWDSIKNGFQSAKDGVVRIANGLADFFTGLPRRIASAVSGMWDGITNGFRSAINAVIRLWNDFRIDFAGYDIPGPGPNIPGFTIDTPNLPYLAKGGTAYGSGFSVVGERGPELAWLPTGASVHSNADSAGLLAAAANSGSGMSPVPVNIYLDREKVGGAIVDFAADHSRRNGYPNPFSR